jgi:la-related protein 1
VKRRSKTTSQQKEAQSQSTAEQKAEKEELDFQFDEEMHFEDEIIPQGGGRINNFSSELTDDEESDFELSDRDINKLLIVTQVKNRPPKHEGE